MTKEGKRDATSRIGVGKINSRCICVPFTGGHSCAFVLAASRYRPSADLAVVTICIDQSHASRKATHCPKNSVMTHLLLRESEAQ